MKPKGRTKNHDIINRFIDLEKSKGDKYFWPREMKLASKLLKSYPFEFLVELREPFKPFKMNSLAWFQCSEGKTFLTNWYFEYQGQKTNLTKEIAEISLTPDKIGDDVVIEQPKPKTLKDFLNRYGKKGN